MNEETELFVKKLNKLNDLVIFLHQDSMRNYVNKDEINHLKRKLNKILDNVKNDKSLNAGGKFEWVDSLLVKVKKKFFFNSFTV